MSARHIAGFSPCRPGTCARPALRALMTGLVAVGLAFVLVSGAARAEGARMALVVGNADYDALAAVPGAARDARQIAETLEAQDFEVSLLLNSDSATFRAGFDSFARRAETAGMVLFYFAGHGLRGDGVNQLAPIDLALDDANAAVTAGLALAPLVDRLATGTRPAVIVLDASHRFDLSPQVAARVAPGLGAPPPGREALVVMATQPGSLVADAAGVGFALDLSDALATPGQPLETVLQNLAASVSSASDGRQTPWIRSNLSDPLFLRPFQPDETDFARLAAMPEAQQAFLLDIWRSQGAQIDTAQLARRLGTPTTTDTTKTADTGMGTGGAAIPDPPAPPPQTAAPETTAAPRFSFEYIDEEETPPTAAPEAPEATAAITPPRETTHATGIRTAPETAGAAAISGGVSVAALPAQAAQTSSRVADTPIVRIRANQDSFVLASLDAGRNLRPAPEPGQRIIGKDVTDRFFAPDDLPRAVQTELARLGCYRAGVDGDWGNGSRRALRDYITRSGADLDAREPTEKVWRALKAASGTVCPTPVARPPQPAAGGTNRNTAAAPAPAPAPPAPASAPAAGGVNTERLRGALRGAFR